MGRDLNSYRKKYYLAKNMNGWAVKTTMPGQPALLAFCFGILENGKFVDEEISIRLLDEDNKDVTGKYLKYPVSRSGMQYVFLDHGLHAGKNLIKARCVTGDSYQCGLDYTVYVIDAEPPAEKMPVNYFSPEEWSGRGLTTREKSLLGDATRNMAFLDRRRRGIPDGRYPKEVLEAVLGHGAP